MSNSCKQGQLKEKVTETSKLETKTNKYSKQNKLVHTMIIYL